MKGIRINLAIDQLTWPDLNEAASRMPHSLLRGGPPPFHFAEKNGLPGTQDPLEEFKEHIGKTLLLTLEILVAADVIETVAFSKTFQSVALLGVCCCGQNLTHLVSGCGDGGHLALEESQNR
jgi:hypothetical protein